MSYQMSEAGAGLEPIRRAMLQALGHPVPQAHTILLPRIVHAVDAQRLWHLRSELMHALATMHGEQQAACELERISEMFGDLLPDGLACAFRRK